jgi:tetratricopeptide (TPR) repeat protein
VRTCAVLLLLPGIVFSHPCASCHPKEVDGYLRTSMGRSLRQPSSEPDGSYEHAKSDTRFLVRSNQNGLFQRMQHGGQNSDFRIDYVIGSGSHATCYLARVGDHLFESPICSYPGRGYAMAPGYEHNPAPAFTRPITMECLLCHSDKPLPIPESLNRYRSPAFVEEAISCDRCHGDPAAHLKRPVPGSIVNPAKLAPTQRDSVCERCHLAGAIRVLNPGRNLADFRPGQTLESVFTTYVATTMDAATAPLKVISQSEQLASSQCSRGSNGQMWCATCHDPHSQPRDSVAYYRERCLNCHQSAFPSDHPSRASNCLPCHMPEREAQDGGHTAFTDHRIERRPKKEDSGVPIENLRAWREPAPALRARNKALALNDAGQRYSSSTLLAQSYPLLLQVEKTFPNDPDVLAAIGSALLDRKEPLNAAKLFERALEIRRDDPSIEDNAGTAWLAAGDKQAAAHHFEQALKLDPLLLPDIEALLRIYRELGEHTQEAALMRSVQEAMKTGPAPAPKR